MPTDTTSVAKVRDLLRRAGVDARDVTVSPTGLIICAHCSTEADPEQFERIWRHRVEGPTDPSEAETMSGLRCPRCKQHGVLVLPYGPAADEVQSDVLVRLLPPETERIEDVLAAVPIRRRLGAGTREARTRVSALRSR